MYKIVITKKADKTLHKLPRFVVKQLWNKFERLSKDISILEHIDTITNPKSIGIDTNEILYKMRVADYRCLFVVEDDIITITIIDIDHRSKVYKKH